jgi:sulfotransferase family protein
LSSTVEDIERAVVTLAEVWRGRTAETFPKPNLIGVGSGRCGTSNLYGLLREQTDVYATPVKEANYFGLASRRGMSLTEYGTFFAGRRDQRWTAEITPVYMYAPGALEEIREALGPIRLIATVRNPLTRLVSHFKFHRQFHGFTDLGEYLRAGFAAMDTAPKGDWASPAQGIRMSLYADGLDRARSLFGPENVLVMVYEELSEDPAIWVRQLSDFLETPITPADRYRNASRAEDLALPDDPVVGRVLDLFAADADRLEPLLGREVVSGWADQIKTLAYA